MQLYKDSHHEDEAYIHFTKGLVQVQDPKP
jgi:hypothetical protein